MQSNEVKAFLEKVLPDAEIIVTGEGCDFQLTIISEHFNNMPAVKRQQAIYLHLGSFITNGSIHAVSMKTFTPQEWTQQSDYRT